MFVVDSILSSAPMVSGLWAYGPAPGVELIPYFLGLAAWVAMAFLAVLLAPFPRCFAASAGQKRLLLNPSRKSKSLPTNL